ncbi:MAG: type II secretion system protein [Candidatus Liptonbacteria bacterium]
MIEKYAKTKQRGFTLIEVLIATALAAIIVLAIGKFSSTISSIGTVLNGSLQVNQDLQAATRALVTDIRSIQPSSLGGYPIEQASTSSFAFYSDVDQDGLAEWINYYATTSTLEEGIIKPTGDPLQYATSTEVKKIIVPNLKPGTGIFQYFGSSYAGTSTPLASPVDISEIRVVQISLTADISTSTAPKPFTYNSIITIRNLRSN